MSGVLLRRRVWFLFFFHSLLITILKPETTTTTSMKPALKPTRYPDDGEPLTLSSPVKEVGFGRIAFREYPIIMGGNPSVSEGVPVELDWHHINEYDVEVDSYEIAANKAFTCTLGSRRCPKLDVTERAQL